MPHRVLTTILAAVAIVGAAANSAYAACPNDCPVSMDSSFAANASGGTLRGSISRQTTTVERQNYSSARGNGGGRSSYDSSSGSGGNGRASTGSGATAAQPTERQRIEAQIARLAASPSAGSGSAINALGQYLLTLPPDPVANPADPAAPPAPAAPVVDVATIAREAATTIQLPEPDLHLGPEPSVNEWNMLAVGQPVWFWTTTPATLNASTTQQGIPLTLTATLQATTINTGDDTTHTCATTTPRPTTADPLAKSPDCGHTWTVHGTYPVTATTHWTITWSALGHTGTLPMERTTTRQVTVGQLASVLVPNPTTGRG